MQKYKKFTIYANFIDDLGFIIDDLGGFSALTAWQAVHIGTLGTALAAWREYGSREDIGAFLFSSDHRARESKYSNVCA